MLVLLAAFIAQKDGGDSGAKDDGGDGGGGGDDGGDDGGDATECAADGSDYSWSDTVSGATRTIATTHCPNRATANLNPGKAIVGDESYGVPAVPMLGTSDLSLAAVGGIVGVALDGAMIYSAYAGSVALEGYTTSANYLEGDTFDQCGGHSSSAESSSYHYHVAPSCLLAQLDDLSDGHSPQIGWMADGFPLYGPLGPGGVAMKQCTGNADGVPCVDAW